MVNAPAKTKTGRSRSEGAGSVRTLERGLHVLSALAGLGQATLSQVARQVDLSPSTTYRLLETLRQQGYADWDEVSGLFRVGWRAFQVGASFSAHDALTRAALPLMQQLAAQHGETVNLATLRPGPDGTQQAVYIAQAQTQQLMRMFTQLGAVAPLHCSGVGKVLLAAHSPEQVAAWLGPGPYTRYTPHTLTALKVVQHELKQVAAQGYALDDEERELGVRCLAVPVKTSSGEVLAALSLSAPTSRFPKKGLPDTTRHLQSVAGQIVDVIGRLTGEAEPSKLTL